MRTSGTFQFLNFGGRVKVGKEPFFSSNDSVFPKTSGKCRLTASVTISAGNSPPESTKSPIEISSSAICSATRSSTPSYRPQTNMRSVYLLKRFASFWVNFFRGWKKDYPRFPPTLAVGAPTLSGVGVYFWIALYIGSTDKTIPGPPPNGRSSTFLCLPKPNGLKLTRSNLMIFFFSARPKMDE